MGKGISRRALLQGLGAAALAAPILGSSRWRRAEAQSMPRPRRLVVLYTPHGAPAEFFWPKSATDLTATGAISILAPLQKHAARLNVLRGIDYVGSDNHYANKDVLTAKGPDSLDTVVARKLGVKPLRLGVVPDYAQSFTVDGYFTMDAGKPVQGNPDPAAALDALVGGLPAMSMGPAPAPMATGPSAAQLRRRALEVTDAELAELQARLAGTPPRAKLDAHRAALATMLAAGASTPTAPSVPIAGCTSKPGLASVEKVRGKNVWAQESFGELMDAQVDVAAFALRCGVTRVVTLQAGYVNHGVPFTWLGIGGGHHGLSHGVRDQHALCQQWFALKFAALLDGLNVPDPEDPAHTVLDNTTALWCTEIADGQAHNCQSVPMVVAGGGSGYFKTGQYLQLGSVSHATVLTSLAESMGVTGATFGGPGALAEVKA
ncbi:MAG: hypothetical protein JWN44_4601 [Myxococcales bacterium]|nr:hypothetical protein [Myxococcales bacterium]